MKHFVLVFIVFINLTVLAQTSDVLDIHIDASNTHQTIHSFGASDSWRVQFVGKNWPLEKRNQIADLLFSLKDDEDGNPLGIGLSTWRFYVGAGTMEQGDASGIKNVWRRAECFQNPDGSYDWSKYQGQKWFLQAAKKRGVENFLIYSISPPVHMSKNGLGYANKGDTGFNLVPQRYGDYANYLTDIIDHFQKEEEINFKYVSPFNEPQWKWDEPNQEGTPGNNSELFEFIKVLSSSLENTGLETEIVPGEAGSINYLFAPGKHPKGNQIQTFFDPNSELFLGDLPNMKNAISGHSYFSTWPIKKQIEQRQKLRARILEVNSELEYWQTEFCILEKNEEIEGGWGRDTGMGTALYVARVIHSDLTIANSCTWEWWTALSQFDYKDGLIHLDDGVGNGVRDDTGSLNSKLQFDGEITPTKLLWALGNFSRFVRPGMQRIEVKVDNDLSLEEQAKDLQVAGFRDNNGTIVIVLINHNISDNQIELKGFESLPVSTHMYITDENRDLEKISIKTNQITIPRRSVTTIVMNDF